VVENCCTTSTEPATESIHSIVEGGGKASSGSSRGWNTKEEKKKRPLVQLKRTKIPKSAASEDPKTVKKRRP